MSKQKPEISAGRAVLSYVAVFACTLLIARFIVDLAQYGILIRKESWLTASAWIGPVGFALIGCFAYWYRTRR